MALQKSQGRISVNQFASLPPITLGDVTIPEVKRGPISTSITHHGVPLEEGCIITKSVRYTHQLARLVNAGDFGKEIEAVIEQGLKIIPYDDFRLDDSCNLVFLDPFVHVSLDLYGLIALTPSLQTVIQLINDVRSDNDRRQKAMNASGVKLPRSLNSFTDPEYELVVLHPEHLLPGGGVLTIYNRANNTYKQYVVSDDRCLRESVDPNSARLPPFRHDTQQRDGAGLVRGVNIFLVALNAEIKFRRYSRMA
ncbi:hypothetical protein M378DRAFT_534927 [Amanita muscaria Koide BX008]|uniref:Uncharacterized protein n=1 Tax=Amanita muscaria (strain Koide BX008) TaxID=946122 RepID=A0A0C2TEH7_AMAMK|nr:hypothetical protein M378DRAFT_534927 [Amanita muscaria Koide BX008]